MMMIMIMVMIIIVITVITIIMTTLSAHIELGMCRTSLISSEQPVLCIPIRPTNYMDANMQLLVWWEEACWPCEALWVGHGTHDCRHAAERLGGSSLLAV